MSTKGLTSLAGPDVLSSVSQQGLGTGLALRQGKCRTLAVNPALSLTALAHLVLSPVGSKQREGMRSWAQSLTQTHSQQLSQTRSAGPGFLTGSLITYLPTQPPSPRNSRSSGLASASPQGLKSEARVRRGGWGRWGERENAVSGG